MVTVFLERWTPYWCFDFAHINPVHRDLGVVLWLGKTLIINWLSRPSGAINRSWRYMYWGGERWKGGLLNYVSVRPPPNPNVACSWVRLVIRSVWSRFLTFSSKSLSHVRGWKVSATSGRSYIGGTLNNGGTSVSALTVSFSICSVVYSPHWRSMLWHISL
jgi:hypothetical protein